MFKSIEHKVFRDPIYGYINVYHQVIWDIINTKEFQRLRRIKQLGASFMVYPTAEHSRFSHSLGVYNVAYKMIQQVSDLKDSLVEYDKMTVLLAALLHDIGHGPFSHSFESISEISHEKYSEAIILGDSEVNQVLVSINENLPLDVAKVINHTHPNKLLSQIVSSQLDADRMDYLLRDSYFTGTSYGNFDLNRILRTMKVVDNKLVVKESGVHAVEDYIMARYHMYWNVYFHPVSRSYEAILLNLFKRLKDLKNSAVLDDYPILKQYINTDVVDIDLYFKLDEGLMFYYFNKMQNSSDKVLADLSNRLLNRKLFDYLDLKDNQLVKDVEAKLLENGYDSRYYLKIDKLEQTPYLPYSSNSNSIIYVLNRDNEVVELSLVSEIVAAISKGKEKVESKIFFAKEINI